MDIILLCYNSVHFFITSRTKFNIDNDYSRTLPFILKRRGFIERMRHLLAVVAVRKAPAAWETVSPAVNNVSSIMDFQFKIPMFCFLKSNSKNILFKSLFAFLFWGVLLAFFFFFFLSQSLLVNYG